MGLASLAAIAWDAAFAHAADPSGRAVAGGIRRHWVEGRRNGLTQSEYALEFLSVERLSGNGGC